jgi:hypothetical protein
MGGVVINNRRVVEEEGIYLWGGQKRRGELHQPPSWFVKRERFLAVFSASSSDCHCHAALPYRPLRREVREEDVDRTRSSLLLLFLILAGTPRGAEDGHQLEQVRRKGASSSLACARRSSHPLFALTIRFNFLTSI